VSRRLLIPLCCAAALASSGAGAGCLDGDGLTGVNLAGGEFNSKRLPGKLNKDYTYPSREELAYWAGKGASAIRVPFRWERVQRQLGQPLDEGEVAALTAVVDAAVRLDLCVILDAHNYGTYAGQPIGSPSVPDTALADVWVRLARRFADPKRVALDLMNEPKAIPIERWAALAQDTVNALRAAGAEHLILVAGGRWSGVHDWHRGASSASNATAFAGFADPLGRMAIEVHQYADADFSGTHRKCRPAERFDPMFEAIAKWARANGQRLFLGEFGVPADDPCLAVLDRFLTLTRDRDIWLGWTYWAAGRWWRNYPLSIAPSDGEDAPQMAVVAKHLGRGARR
jgi:endoglucanase